MIISLQLNNTPSELEVLGRAVESMAEEWGLTGRQIFEVNLILEELCVNIIYHGGQSEGHLIHIDIVKERGVLVITLMDDGPPFDPTCVPPADISQALAKRTAGGLGIHLVKQYTESMDYRREQGKNILTVRKKI